jgi:hypothetical protein
MGFPPPPVACQKVGWNTGNHAGLSGIWPVSRQHHRHASCGSLARERGSICMAVEKIAGRAKAKKQQEARDDWRVLVLPS